MPIGHIYIAKISSSVEIKYLRYFVIYLNIQNKKESNNDMESRTLTFFILK